MKLTAPRFVTFALSLVLVGLAVASLYTRIPTIGPTIVSYRTWILVGAWALLALGVTTRRL